MNNKLCLNCEKPITTGEFCSEKCRKFWYNEDGIDEEEYDDSGD